MKDDKIQTILLVIAFIGALISVVYVILHPVTYTELPLEKQIQYKQTIFP